MKSWWVGEFTENRLYRDLFWDLASIAPFVFLGFIGLILTSARRRLAALGLLVALTGAALATAVFHFNYALEIWRGHESAIKYLDESAFLAGFAGSTIAYLAVILVYAAMTKLFRRPGY